MLDPVGEYAGELGGDALRLGELLELLHRADAAFDSVEVTYRIWRHTERAAAAWQAAIEERRRRGTAVASYAFAEGSEPPIETEEVLRIWRARNCVWAEHEGGLRDGHYAVRQGDVWWSWDEHSGAISNQEDPRVGFSVGNEVSVMLNPTPLLGVLRFSLTGRGRMAGQDTLTAEAVARSADPREDPRAFELHQLGAGADRYELHVDALRGVLLEAIAVRADLPFFRITTERIVFDQPIAPERFRFQPPAGEAIRSTGERRRMEHVPVAEAQRRAPFTILVPARIPPDWHSRCAFIEASQRPRSPACVSLNFHSDDGHESVSLSEYAAADKPDQYELMSRGEGWRTITRDGADVRIRTPGTQNQAYVEREGTFAFLMSESLTGDELATLAAGLKPARTTGGI